MMFPYMDIWLDNLAVFLCAVATMLGVGAEVMVRGEGQGAVSQGTQTGDESELVQIRTSLPEVSCYLMCCLATN